jgi:hypothetical protein
VADFGAWNGDTRSSIGLVVITPSGTAHTKGAWATQDGPTPDRVDGLYISPVFFGDSYTRRTVLVDVGVGAGPTVLINNLMVCPAHASATNNLREVAQHVYFPVCFPPSELFKMRAQSNMASHPDVFAYAMPMRSGMPCVGSVVDTYGADTANSKGTTLTASGTEGVYGSWVQLTASSERVKALVLAFGHGQADWSTFTNQWAIVEIGVGGAGSEVEILTLADIAVSSGTQILAQQMYGPYFVDIPAGTRVSARVRKQYTSASQRTIDVILYGIR